MLESLLDIARQLDFKDIEARLMAIDATLNNGKAELIVPFVGEFSAGKTTLINALTDSKDLECGITPTTNTIYTIHFGADKRKAVVHNPDGSTEEVTDFTQLTKERMKDVVVVDVYDTSTRVPESIVLVDTPGLSSNETKHRQTLVNFLPMADAILLAVDVNAQLTRSLTDFAKTMALSKRPQYLVLTQCKTKVQSEVEATKEYIRKHSELPMSDIVSVSAKEGDLDELYSLLNRIQNDKTAILAKVNDQRCRDIANEMVARIDTLLSSAKSDESLDDAVREQQLKLNKIKRQIASAVDSITSELDDIKRKVSREFEDSIFARLDSIVTGKSDNYDAEAISAINNTASLYLNQFKDEVNRLLTSTVRAQAEGDDSVDLSGLLGLDLSQYGINDVSYNLSLNEVGHEWDKGIANGVKIAAVVVAIAATAGVAAPAAAATSTAAGAATALTAGQKIAAVAGVADTVSDVASMISNKRLAQKLEKVMKYGKKVGTTLENGLNKGLAKAELIDSQLAQQFGKSKGFVESIVGPFTEATLAKPRRQRAIHQYLELQLIPTFKNALEEISEDILALAIGAINKGAEDQTAQVSASLQSLKQSREEQQSSYEARIEQLRQFKQQINNQLNA